MAYPQRLTDLTSAEWRRTQAHDCMHLLSAMAFASRSARRVPEYFEEMWPTSPHASIVRKAFDPDRQAVELDRKAAVLPGTTGDPAWAAPLVPEVLLAGFLPLLRASSAVSQLNLRRVPPNAKVPRQTSDASFSWTAEHAVKPISKFGFGTVAVKPAKCSGIIVLTSELVQLMAPGTEDVMAQALADGVNNFVDRQFLDPTVAAVPGQNPASILNGLTPVATTGTLDERIAALIAAFATLRPGARRLALVMSPSIAAQLAGGGRHPALTADGGQAFGIKTVTTPAAETRVVLLDPDAVLLADAGLRLDVSDEAVVEMNSTPANPATATTVLVSFWQENLVGIRAERFVSWQAAPDAVAYTVTTP